MALLNLGNPNPVLRVEAYNLLAALCSSFNLSVQTSLWETSGLCIPKNTNNFIVSLSKKLATNNSSMTLEFLMEALHGIEKIKANLPGKQLSLNYITHWLPNLRLFCVPSNKPDYATNVEKTKEIIHLLTEFTIRETSVFVSSKYNTTQQPCHSLTLTLTLTLSLSLTLTLTLTRSL